MPKDIKTVAQEHTDAAIKVLTEIMNDSSVEPKTRVAAATQVLNRGLGPVVDPTKFAPVIREFYVYTVHGDDGGLMYIGKGSGSRHMASARQLGGKPRIRAEFDRERDALAFERRLIERFNPPANKVYARH